MTDAAGNRVSLAGLESGTGIATGAASAGLLTVMIRGLAIVMQANQDVAFAAGDQVAFMRCGSYWVALARLGTAPPVEQPDKPDPVTPKPVVVTGTRTFTPVETRSYRSGKWRTDNDDVYQGQYGGNGNHIGCAFYGNGPRSLAGATVTSAMVKVRRRSAGGITAPQSTTLRLVTQKTRPSGAPTLGSSTSGPSLQWGASTTFTIPDSWAQAMVDGTAGGLAVYDSGGSPYVILDGHGSYGAAFSLTIRYQR